MSVEVILLERIQKLGRLGDKVKVAPGYARNFLIPKKKAILAIPANLVEFERQQGELKKQEDARIAAVRARAADLDGMNLSFSMRVSEDGKLFGSVGIVEIANAMKEAGTIIHRSEIVLPEPIRQLGAYEVVISLEHGDILAKVNVIISAEA